MEQNRVAALQRRYLLQQHARRDATQKGGGGLRIADPIGDADKMIRRVESRRGVGTERAVGVDHPIAHGDTADTDPHRLDDTRPFVAKHRRKRRRLERAATKVHLDEIEPDRGVSDQRLPRPRQRDLDGLDGQHLGRTILVNADSAFHLITFAPNFAHTGEAAQAVESAAYMPASRRG